MLMVRLHIPWGRVEAGLRFSTADVRSIFAEGTSLQKLRVGWDIPMEILGLISIYDSSAKMV